MASKPQAPVPKPAKAPRSGKTESAKPSKGYSSGASMDHLRGRTYDNTKC